MKIRPITSSSRQIIELLPKQLKKPESTLKHTYGTSSLKRSKLHHNLSGMLMPRQGAFRDLTTLDGKTPELPGSLHDLTSKILPRQGAFTDLTILDCPTADLPGYSRKTR